MATLEVHDDQGRVQFVELARDHPMLFGTSQACDIVLAGEGVEPVHGRIRWKKGRYRVEASPGAQFVVVNGQKMTSSSFRQGDEMLVGPCRVFMFRVDEDLEGPSRRPAPRRDEERTRVVEGPPPFVAAATEPRPAPKPKPAASESLLERAEWLEELGLGDHPAGEEPVVELPDGKSGATPGRLQRWLRALRDESDDAPGRERLSTSPLVLGLLATLGLLILAGFGLRTIIARTAADQQFNRAMQAMEDGDYRNAIRDFDRFLEGYPEDRRAEKARVRRAMANVRQYITVSGGTWSTALDAAREMYQDQAESEEFRDDRVELAELVIRIGEGLADRARRGADAKSLQEAESAVKLHAEIAGEPAAAFLKKSRLPGLIDQARAAVHKADDRGRAIAAMDAALQAGSAAGVYKARDSLVERYADLARDAELVKRMTQANELIRKGVKVSRDRRAAAGDARAEVLGPPTSLVLRSQSSGPSGAPPPESIVSALADGIAYALDARSGAPLWQRFVGLASPFPPQPIPGTPSVVVVDARHNELLKLDARDGKLAWRLGLGEAVEGPPLALGEQLFQPLPSGKLLEIGLGSGEVQATVELGLALSRSPVADEQGRYLYLLGRRDCLFVLARESLECRAVEYLGHQEAAIACTPARVGRFLIVVENDRPADGRWNVLVLDDEGAKVRPVQQVEVPGWTWSTPAASGSVVWATADRGGIEAYALGDYASKTPLRLLARLDPDAGASGPAFGLALSDRELWLAAPRSGKYDLDPERGLIAVRSALSRTGPATAPVQLAGRTLVATYQDPATGGTSLYGLDPESGSVSWQTVLGAPWPSEARIEPAGGGLKYLGQSGKDLSISSKLLGEGGFATLPLPRPGELRLPEGVVLDLAAAGGGKAATLVAPREGPGRVWAPAPDQPGGWRSFELPSSLAAPPLVWGRGLLVPGADGRAYLVDPTTSRSIAEPFVPVFSRDRQGRWLAPCRLDSGAVALADRAGRVRILSHQEKPVSRLVADAEKLLDRPIVADPVATRAAVLVVTEDRQVRALSTRDLSAAGAWPLEAPMVERPMSAGERAFVYDAGGGVMAFGPDGQRLWSIRLEAPAVGPPIIHGDLAWFLDREGRLHGLALADGAPRRQLDLAIDPAGAMIELGGRILIPAARGSLRPLAPDRIPAS